MPAGSAADRARALREAGALPPRPGDPDRIGPYVPLGLLGSGGMGRVYLARPVDGGPDLVAVKVIRPEYAEDLRFRRRFEHEASVHSRVRTPRMPRLSGTGFRDELLWMATEYLPGLDLAAAVHEDGPLPAVAVRRLVAELGQALADLSAAGIVHRDLKPSNVLLSARGAHVIDFGIAKAADASAITGTGNRVGTPAYMSPEYLRTGECDTASDVFSLACTLVFAATGSAPFGDGTGVDVMHRVAFEEPNPKVITEMAAADAALAALLSACLAKEPGHRPTPQQLIQAVGHGSGEREAAGPSETSGWPGPLGGRVLARQQAYEVLRRLPLEQPGPEPANEAPSPSADAPAQGLPPTRPRTGTHRRRMLVGTAGLTVCAVAAGVLVLTLREPDTSVASPETGTATAVGDRPGDGAPATATGDPRSGAAPDGGSDVSEVSGEGDGETADDDGTTSSDESDPDSGPDSGSDDRPGDSSTTPATETSAPPEVTPSPSDVSTEPATPAWISDCAYYSGNGRTRLGQSGKRVLQVQCILTKRGYGVGDGGLDGEFGSGTQAAVQQFQSDRGMVANGVVQRRTWVALRATE
ncbi:protein kinase domain-containing protein [Streptomyces adelaidensis]|uniref:protein kinase domain-containing protein n=1 Tax=Streptomyces adelaidensis TaxID=2796465 RepID=UPI0027DD817D|nr:protein kinase [Streptomyces adelaidensis]